MSYTPPYRGVTVILVELVILKGCDMEKIYVLRGKGTNFFKIGRTSQPVEWRQQQLQTGCPFAIEIYATFPTFWPSEMEKFLHSYLAEFRTNGEWLAVEPEIVDSILSMSATTVDGNGVLSVLEDDHGWKIILREWMRDSSGHIAISASCLTLAEIERECMDVVKSAMGILAKARQQKDSGKSFAKRAAKPE